MSESTGGRPSVSVALALPLSDREARDLHLAVSTTLSLMEQVGDVPPDAPLYGAEKRLERVARRLDHLRRHDNGVVPAMYEVGGDDA